MCEAAPVTMSAIRADELVGYSIARVHSGAATIPAGEPTNRAFLRAAVRRWRARTGHIR
ncbi:hypothetical protein MAHJHV63_52990 [Mycobacterium avium subsp. hominissuis]